MQTVHTDLEWLGSGACRNRAGGPCAVRSSSWHAHSAQPSACRCPPGLARLVPTKTPRKRSCGGIPSVASFGRGRGRCGGRRQRGRRGLVPLCCFLRLCHGYVCSEETVTGFMASCHCNALPSLHYNLKGSSWL